MTESSWCKTCDAYMLYPEHHKCPPSFYIEFGDYMDDELKEIMATDKQAAAEKFGQWYDNSTGEYDIAGNSEEITITVYDDPEDKTTGTLFLVDGEMLPEYRAAEIERGSKLDPEVIAQYQKTIDNFNKSHPVGSTVFYKNKSGETVEGKLQYPARMEGPCRSSIWVNGGPHGNYVKFDNVIIK